MDNEEIYSKLKEIALKRTIPFCYSDYIECPTGKCLKCGSDDLMRLLPGNGCEYGLGWVIDEILKEELSPVDTADAFEDSIRSCYEEKVQIGWMTLDAVSVMKEMDPTSWRCAQSEWESEELDAGSFYSPDNGSTIYEMRDIERLIEEDA